MALRNAVPKYAVAIIPHPDYKLSETSAAPKIRLRIENLSDLVFGLALSIGSIVLISKLPQTPSDLVSGIVLFGFSFLLVVWIWFNYTTTITALPYEVRGTFLLNIMLLFCVAVEPYLFYVVVEGKSSLVEFASSVYALDVGAMLFILAGVVQILLNEEKKRGSHDLSPDRLKRFRRYAITRVAGGVIFLVSALPLFWTPVPIGQFLRFDIWYAIIVILLLAARVRGKASGEIGRDDETDSKQTSLQ
jgi:uncharacterized membrane protein